MRRALAIPYDAAAIERLKWVQSADVIYLVDGQRPMQRLSRFGLANWTIETMLLRTGPFQAQNLDDALTIKASAETGSAITLTANTARFSSSMVNMVVRLVPDDDTAEKLFTTNETVIVGERRRYSEYIYQLVMVNGSTASGSSGNVGEEPPQHREGVALTNNKTSWRYVGDSTGIVRITAVASGTSATARVISRIPKACVDTPTYRWSLGAWNTISGFPSAVEIFDQRLVAAATTAEPRTVWFSAVGDFADFGDGTNDDEPFAYTISGSSSVNSVLELCRARNGLVVFALGEEVASRSESRATVISAKTAVFEAIGNSGSNGARPVAPDGDPIYITRDEGRVMQLSYDLSSDGLRSGNLSRPAQHIGRDRFAEIAWQRTPEPTAWLRLANGALAAMIYDKTEEVLGWAIHTLADGEVESIAVVPDITGAQDVVMMIVARRQGATVHRFVEEMALPYAMQPDAGVVTANHYFAATKVENSTPFETALVPQLWGSVHAWTDAGCFVDLVPDNIGRVTFPVPVTSAIIGWFDSTHEARTLNVPTAAPNGSTAGRYRRLKGVTVGLYRSTQGEVSIVGKTIPRAAVATPYRTILQLGVAVEPLTLQDGDVSVDITSGQHRECQISIRPWSGAPLTITSITPIVEEAGE